MKTVIRPAFVYFCIGLKVTVTWNNATNQERKPDFKMQTCWKPCNQAIMDLISQRFRVGEKAYCLFFLTISIPVTSSFLRCCISWNHEASFMASWFADLLSSDSSPDRPLCSFHLSSYRSLWLLGKPGQDSLQYLSLGLNTMGRSPKTYR